MSARRMQIVNVHGEPVAETAIMRETAPLFARETDQEPKTYAERRSPRPARVKFYGRIDGSNGATITLDRARGVVVVRPFRRRRTYEMLFEDVALMILHKIVKGEKLAAKAAKAKARRKR